MEKKKKIGVVTFWTAKGNYGQLLQAYALQRVLREAGHDAFLVRYDYRNNVRDKWRKLFNPLIVARYLYIKWFKKPGKEDMGRAFDRFLAEHLVCSEVFRHQRLNAAAPPADAYICGSDQVWNGVDANFYLNFTPTGSRKIAYAASTGGHAFSDGDIRAVGGWLRDFDFISVRERSGAELCRKAGRQDAVCVPDPTMLLPASAYRQLAVKPAAGRKYLLLYMIGWKNNELEMEHVRSFAREKGLEVIFVSNQASGGSCPQEYPTIPEWLGLVDGAEYVITNSFHGTVFSILFNKRFSVVLLSGRTIVRAMNERIDTLLRLTGLEGRVLGDDIHAIEASIDYAPVNAAIDRERDRAIALLMEAIG